MLGKTTGRQTKQENNDKAVRSAKGHMIYGIIVTIH